MKLHNEIQVGGNNLCIRMQSRQTWRSKVNSGKGLLPTDAVQGKVTADSVSSHNLTLNHSEVQTTYRCLLNAEEVESVSVNVTSRGTVTITQPDTAYNITCLGYDNQGRDLCHEENLSIITSEFNLIKFIHS